MLSRLIATVAALLLACTSPQAHAHVRAERVSVSSDRHWYERVVVSTVP